MSIRKMIALHPKVEGHVNQPLGDAAHHLMYCARMCLSCADADLAEEVDMTQCIRACLDCADVCEATGSWRSAAPAPTTRCCAKCSKSAPGFATPARPSANAMTSSIAASVRRCAANAPRTAAMQRPASARGSRLSPIFPCLDDLLYDHVALQPRQMIDEQHAIEVVDLVLQADRHQPVERAFLRRAMLVLPAGRTTSAARLGILLGDRQAALV
jgi:hypothetical protein